MISDLHALREKIETEAFSLGFNHIGIAPALPAPHYPDFLAWIKVGHHAEMDYLAREDAVQKRGDPTRILDNCQRVILLAMPYKRPQTPINAENLGKGRLSAYAVTRDYHEIIWEKLAHLETFIQNKTNQLVALKSYVDTGPVLERAYASRAGIGITGKNSCLIIQGTGSYFFLAEILTDLVLPVDAPYTRDLCGSCRRCIEACPTQCILPNHTIDAGRCISYLTIENKGAIPDDLKDQIGSWAFGCDVCQAVCPHNAWTSDQTYPLGEPVLPEWIDLAALFYIDEAAFRNKFGQTPLSRAKRRGILRNAAVVLGNQRHQAALPALKTALAHEKDPVIQDSCRWAINKIEQKS